VRKISPPLGFDSRTVKFLSTYKLISDSFVCLKRVGLQVQNVNCSETSNLVTACVDNIWNRLVCMSVGCCYVFL
jgi:hypothetical protein